MDGNKKLLTPIEITALLIGIMADVNSAGVPNIVVNYSKQDGWVSAALGAVYPLYVCLIAIYISSKFPEDNILKLSKKYFGSILGTLLNFLFFLSLFSYFPSACSLAMQVSRTYVVGFLTPAKIYIIMLLLGGFTAYKGIKVIGRICVLNIFMLLFIVLLSFSILIFGSILNVMPMFNSSIYNIIKGAANTSYDYAAIELIFLIYPFIDDKKKIKSSTLYAVAGVCFFYTWVTFVTIYCLGIDFIPKTIWGFFYATEAIRIEAMHNFRYIYIFLWIIIAFKSIVVLYYTCIFILNSICKYVGNKISYVIFGGIVLIITMVFYGDRLSRESIVAYTTKLSISFNLIYITVIAAIIFLKKDGKSAIK